MGAHRPRSRSQWRIRLAGEPSERVSLGPPEQNTEIWNMNIFPGGTLAAPRWRQVLRTLRCAAAIRKIRMSLGKPPCESEECAKEEHAAILRVAIYAQAHASRSHILENRYKVILMWFKSP